MPDTSWQAAADQGFDLANFQIDLASQHVTCPIGKTSIYWHPTLDRSQKPVFHDTGTTRAFQSSLETSAFLRLQYLQIFLYSADPNSGKIKHSAASHKLEVRKYAG